MIGHTQKVMTILSSLLVLIGFSDLVCRDQSQGAPLGAYGTLRVPPQLIPPHSVGKPYTYSPPSSIVTLQTYLLTVTPLGTSQKRKSVNEGKRLLLYHCNQLNFTLRLMESVAVTRWLYPVSL